MKIDPFCVYVKHIAFGYFSPQWFPKNYRKTIWMPIFSGIKLNMIRNHYLVHEYDSLHTFCFYISPNTDWIYVSCFENY